MPKYIIYCETSAFNKTIALEDFKENIQEYEFKIKEVKESEGTDEL